MGYAISPKDLKTRLDKGDRLVLVDVREEWEYSLAKLDGSILIPLGTLPQSLAQLNRDSEIIAICHHGMRSADATDFLLDLARGPDGRVGEDAILPAILADSVTVWPTLLKLARDDRVSRRARRQAVFWLGQAAGDAATRGLADLVDDRGVDREVKEQAVFALSQQRGDAAVPLLIRIARTHPDREVRRKALFWLGQSDDPRALALFEELLTKP